MSRPLLCRLSECDVILIFSEAFGMRTPKKSFTTQSTEHRAQSNMQDARCNMSAKLKIAHRIHRQILAREVLERKRQLERASACQLQSIEFP